jgi:hypothetical protein
MCHIEMHSNMNFPAPVAVLGFLAGLGGLALCVVATAILAFFRKVRWIRWIGKLVGAGAIVYFGLLFGFSLGSRETTLQPGDEKYFCEIDCHVAYSVRSTREELRTNERHLMVMLRTRFDETTISPQRPREAPLSPSPREIVLFDDQHRQFTPESISGTALNHALIPGASYETELTFRVPRDAKGLRLLITSPGWEKNLLIGDENSLGHKKTFLAIPGSGPAASANAMPEFSSSSLHD